MQRCPTAFFESEVYPIATQCALAALTFNHRDAYASVMKFFRDLLSSSEEKEVADASSILVHFCVVVEVGFFFHSGY